jgi:hypothetical protein
MKSHFLVPIVLLLAMLLSGTLALRSGTEAIDPNSNEMAVIYRSHFELPGYSGGSASRFMVGDLVVRNREIMQEVSSSSVPFSKIKFEFSIVPINQIHIEPMGAIPENGNLSYGCFHAPREHCSENRILYHINQDSMGYYLADSGDSSTVRYRFECDDESDVMWEIDRIISASLFPSDVRKMVQAGKISR